MQLIVELSICLSYPDPWLVKKPAFIGYTARDNFRLPHSALVKPLCNHSPLWLSQVYVVVQKLSPFRE